MFDDVYDDAIEDFLSTQSQNTPETVINETVIPPPGRTKKRSRPSSTSKKRGWCFTINNPSLAESNALKSLGETGLQTSNVDYLIYGRETGDEGTPHLQGYIHCKSQRAFSAIKNLIGERAHIEAAKGTPDQNRRYCIKDGDFDEWGDAPKQGERTDLASLAKSVVETSWTLESALSEETIDYDVVGAGLRFGKYIEDLRNTMAKKNRRQAKDNMTVIWCYGPPGSGKTKWVYDNHPDAFTYPGEPGKTWFDNYNYEKTIVIDDFRGTKRVGSDADQVPTFTFSYFLRLIDRYEMQIPVKGAYKWLCATTWIITCPWHPSEAYQSSENMGQLLRRITEIKEFTGGGYENNDAQPAINLQN